MVGPTVTAPLPTSEGPVAPTSPEERPGGTRPDDAVLARRAGLGDRAAFAELIDRHGPALHRYAARMLDDPGEAGDCLQGAFLDAWRGLPSFRGEASVRTWLFTLTTHSVRRHQRRHLSRTARPVDVRSLGDPQPGATAGPPGAALHPGSRTEDPAVLVEHDEFVRALDAALLRLPAGQRAAWILREVEGLSYAEIAHINGTTTDIVRGQLARARTTLETRMEAWR